ncbi:MAG TPA: DUF4411 family protein [Candidatus Acidoferrum sp.]|jgi:hypothetical protein|nr:DUF4411 family protein [Candidatus Acidoferrum sp.]
MSTDSARYLIDTSVFIQAFRAYYSFSVCPGFWTSLVSLHNRGLVLSIDKVLEELCHGDEDELSVWAKTSMPKTCFASCDDPAVIGWYAQIQSWANSQSQFSNAAKSEFAGETDAWVVAYAGAKNYIVVTGEVFSHNVKRRIPIPNVCRAAPFQVNCIDVFTMLTRLGIKFQWNEGQQ